MTDNQGRIQQAPDSETLVTADYAVDSELPNDRLYTPRPTEYIGVDRMWNMAADPQYVLARLEPRVHDALCAFLRDKGYLKDET